MKFGWILGLLLAASIAPRTLHAQADVYGEFSAGVLTNPLKTNTLPGVSAGVLFEGPTFAHLQLSPNLQGRFLNTGSERLNGVAVGPRVSLVRKHGFAPFVEVLVGFARYYTNGSNGDTAESTTDAVLQFNGGVARRISPRLDLVADFSYEQFYANQGEYNPKTASIGVIYHFTKR